MVRWFRNLLAALTVLTFAAAPVTADANGASLVRAHLNAGVGGVGSVYFLTTTGTGTWSVPATGTYQVELIAGGGDGITCPDPCSASAQGGRGGQYAKLTGLSLSGGASISYQVGVHGGSFGTPGAAGTSDTWFSSQTTVFAQGGETGGGNGGSYTATGAWTRFNSGAGHSVASFTGAYAGSGAGGPNGAGGNAGCPAPSWGGGAGGGGANGGGAGACASGGTGGAGGLSRLSSGSGAGGTSGIIPGGAGSGGGGGGGGFGAGSGSASSGGNGSTDPVWDATHGPGSGGGGAGGVDINRNGGNGGLYGGGGGGAPQPGTAGIGGQGIIVITRTSRNDWTPANDNGPWVAERAAA